MKFTSRRVLTSVISVCSVVFAFWSTALVFYLVEGRTQVRNLTEIMEGISDLHDRALFRLARPGTNVLADWDPAEEETTLRLAEADFRASRQALDQVLREHQAEPVALDELDAAVEQLLAFARLTLQRAALRNQAVASRLPDKEIRTIENSAGMENLLMDQAFERAHQEFVRIQNFYRQRQYQVFEARASIFRQLYILLVLSLGAVASALMLLRRTARQKEALASSEARYRLLIENASDVMYTTDARGRFRFVSPQTEKLTGYTAPELLGQGFRYLLSPGLADEVTRFYRLQFDEKTPSTYLEFPIVRKDGTPRWVGQTVDAIFDRGEVSGYQAVVRDITERKEAEEAVGQEQARLRALVEENPLGIVLVDRKDQVVDCNPAFEALFGYSRAEISGGDLVHLIVPAQFHEESGLLTARVQAGESVHLETQRQHRDGRLLDVEVYGVPVVVEGRQFGFFVIYQDITERKRAGQQRRLQSAALSAAANSIVITDRSGKILWTNPAFTALTGYSAEEVLGRNPRILNSGHQPASFYAQMWKTILSGAVWHGELVNRRKDGSLYTEEMTLTPVLDADGKISHFIAIKQDITARKKDEAELQQATLAAEAATHLKSEFLANMSHEIRTPMNGIIGMSELLLDTHLDSAQRDYASSVKRCAESLLSLLNDILDLSKIEARRLELESTPFDLREVVEGTVQMLAPSAEAKSLELLCDCDARLPRRVLGDPTRLRQILTNLLGNALKFTERGEIVARVALQGSAGPQPLVRFEVSDTGIGIPAEKQKLIFERFAQADGSTTRRYGGTGLGLAIAFELVDLMGGEMGVVSGNGKGSTFWFNIPYPAVPESAEIPPPTDLRGLSVLVVDDNATTRLILRRSLESFGCVVQEASDAATALALLHESRRVGSPVRVALVDAQMPEVDGAELGKRMQADPLLRSTRMVMLTSIGLRGDAERMRQLGFVGYLIKPARQNQLLAALREAINVTPTPRADDSIAAGVGVDRRSVSGRILLAEDNDVNRTIALNLLEKAGYAVVAAINGREAVDRWQTDSFDLILMDVQMPVMDGLAATQAIRQAEHPGCHVPIIALTAHAMKGDRERCLAAGMDDYLTKPLRKQTVLEMLARWLRGSAPAVAALPEPPPPRQNTPVNVTTLDEVSFGDAAFLQELVESYSADAAALLPALRVALAQGDARAVESNAHRLRGSSVTLGAVALAGIFEQIETKGRTGALDQVHLLLDQAEDEYAAVCAFLETRLHSHVT